MAYQRKSSKHIAAAQALLDICNGQLAKADAAGNEFQLSSEPAGGGFGGRQGVNEGATDRRRK